MEITMQHEAAVHNQTIIAQFSQQAVPFSELPGHSQSMQMLIEMSGVSGADIVLDVACGPGLVACEFAPHAKHVTGIDITPRMIEQRGKV
jgi:ubiquinone/menaquinone biosynthesis C-methylase UbiE